MLISGWPPGSRALAGVLLLAHPILAPTLAQAAPSSPALPTPALTPSAPVVINEVLYDPAGPDAGGEFIELVLAAGASAIDLARLRLERGNGQRPGDWKLVWQGAPGDTLADGRYFVVGGVAVTPPPSATAELELQNGPDACRLLIDGQVADVVGWGDLQAGEFFAGEPAADVASGSSLGRVPDKRSTGRNRSDFMALPAPSPGRANRRPPAVRARSRHHSRADPAPSLLIEVALEAAPESVLPELATAPVEVTAFAPAVPGVVTRASFRLAAGQAAGTLTLAPLPTGPITIGLVTAPGIVLEGEPALPDTIFFAARVGPGPLLVNEFLFRPPPGEPEWIELIHPGPDSLAVDGFALSDEHGEPVPLPSAPMVPPGGLLVLAAAPIALVPSALVLGARWPHLNDTGGPPADRIQLVDAEGRTTDHVAYGGDWAAAGVSVERLSVAIDSEARSAWSAAPDGPTPGRPNGAARELGPMAGFFALDPALVRTGGEGVLFRLAEPLRTGAITVHAADGQLVRRLTSAELRGQRSVRFAALDDQGVALPMGLYLVSVAGEADRSGRVTDPSSARVVARATLVVVP
jgi:hypothetical protein